tara:strand:+ start:642 stop:1166 length:525 start_codon:yes stop_codon:yes gene_type:complete
MTSPTNTSEKRICIGKISSAHGVKGLVKILPYCEDTSLLNGVLFTEETGNKTLTVTLKNSAGKFILAHIEGITTPEDAKLLKCSLYVPREALPDIDDQDEFYIEDLIGLDALNDQGDKIGSVLALENFGAGDLLEIKPPSGSTYYVPFDDDYITAIDLDSRTITLENYARFQID